MAKIVIYTTRTCSYCFSAKSLLARKGASFDEIDVTFLQTGRDKLRVKYSELTDRVRRTENQVRAVTKSREMWERRAKLAEAELAELKKSR